MELIKGDSASLDHHSNRADQGQAHPNAGFAATSLLADVVARRTKWVGPRVELSPQPSTMKVSGKRRLEVETSAVRDALRVLDETGGSEVAPEVKEREGKRGRLRE